METGNCTLHVSGLRAPPKKRTELCGGAGARSRSVAGDLDAAVRKAFGAFGEVVETRVVLDSTKGHWAIVTYSSRAAAEFAKEAMTGQGLRVDGGEIIQVRWAKDQQATSNAAGYCHAPQAKPVPRLPPAQTARPVSRRDRRRRCRRAGPRRSTRRRANTTTTTRRRAQSSGTRRPRRPRSRTRCRRAGRASSTRPTATPTSTTRRRSGRPGTGPRPTTTTRRRGGRKIRNGDLGGSRGLADRCGGRTERRQSYLCELVIEDGPLPPTR